MEIHSELVQRIKEKASSQFKLDLQGIHGLWHWDNVADNGQLIAQSLGLDHRVIQLFAYLHDSCRIDDDYDPDHGLRASEWAASWIRDEVDLNQTQYDHLCLAIRDHNKGKTTDNLIIGACWDADRLDLGRLDIYPDINRMSTPLCRDEQFIAWRMEEMGYC